MSIIEGERRAARVAQYGEEQKVVARSQYLRPLLALAVPIIVPFVVAFGLNRAGYSVGDYFSLIKDGHLTWVRQGVGWIALGGWIALYWPVALKALKNPVYLAIERDHLVGPFGKPIAMTDIKSVRFRRGFFNRFLIIETGRTKHELPITYVSGGIGAIRESLQRLDIRLANGSF